MTDKLETETIDTATLTKLDLAKVLKVMGRMPYGGMISWGGRAPETVDALVKMLESLSGVLEGVARSNEAKEAELHRTQRLIRSGGELLTMMLESAEKREGNA